MTNANRTIGAVFFDIGDTLGTVRLVGTGPRIDRIEVKPEVTQALRDIAACGAQQGIVSNRGSVPEDEVFAALRDAGVLTFFNPSLIVFGRKDNAEIFRQAAARGGFDPRDCIFVGENTDERLLAGEAGMSVASTPEEAAEAVRADQDEGAGGRHGDDSDAPSEKARADFAPVVAAVERHGAGLLKMPGVVGVRPGYRFNGGRITGEPAVSVRVLEKRDAVPEAELIPSRLDGVTVDVVPATPSEQLLYQSAEGFAGGAGGGLVITALPGEGDDRESESDSFAPLEPYVPPDTPLDAVDEEMTVVCHASPDAGWRNLRGFLLGTDERLTVTMYEFTARHILDAFVRALDDGQQFNFIMDAGHQDTSGDDVTKDEVLQVLGQALGDRFRFAWAAVADDSVTSAAFFKNAYHIKVAVRDGKSFWLSSGNFKRSGQPAVDPIHGPLPSNFNPRRFQSGANREWNVIVHGRSLAELMETYILNDIEQAEPLQVQGAVPSLCAPLPDLFVPAALADSFDAEADPQFFEELELTRRLRVQPLLTPDNYLRHILPLVEGAQEKLYFQNQSLKPNASNVNYRRVFRALRDKSRDDNIDVRIIVRGDFNPDNILAALSAQGFEMSRVRLQNGNHNKGILVDDKFTVVGSHNWTGDGTTLNRDASLIFDDTDINAYYTRLFLYDWDNLARAGDESLLAMPRLAGPGEPTPPGMERVAWHDFFSE